MGGTTLVADGPHTTSRRRRGAWASARRAEANYRESLRISEREGFKSMAAGSLHDLGRMALEAGRHRGGGRTAGASPGNPRGAEGPGRHRGGAERPGHAAPGRGPPRRGSRRGAAAGGDRAHDSSSPSCTGKRRRSPVSPIAGSDRPEAARRSFHAGGRGHRGPSPAGRRAHPGPGAVLREQALAVPRADALWPWRAASAREALELAERSKARVLADLVQSGRVDIAGAMSDEDRREEAGCARRLVSLNQKVHAERLRETPDADRLASLEAERQVAAVRLRDLPGALYAKHPDLQVQRGGAAPFTFAEAARARPGRFGSGAGVRRHGRGHRTCSC